MSKKSPAPRRLARRLALQAIYQWQLASTSSLEIENQFLQDCPLDKVDVPYFLELLRGVVNCCESLDAHMKPALDRDIGQLNPVELAILRIALYEFVHRMDIPYRVVIDEALRLAKTFGAIEGYKYVNGVLDNVARSLRTVEIGARTTRPEN
ncbi:MAG TPA: transcription antitermination factor NusB [Gammaproteobacteria bacterium]|nr:transcription antitermination factor NusB [Gammaproteobacteria bacterium]